MNQTKLLLIIFIASFFVLSVLSVSFATPTDTYAHPAYGFTPPPPPPPGGGGGNDDDGGSAGSDGGGTEPTDTVIVEIDRCDLSCSVEYVGAGGNEVLSASVDGAYLPAQNLAVSSDPLPDVEVLIPVQLVHQGSGFIVERTLSDSRSTTISVPYPGQWEVLMVNSPQFVTDGLMDMTGLNVVQLQADVIDDPISLGMVEANAGPQLVRCPVECVIEAEESPFYLPETGSEPTTPVFPPIIGIIFVIGLLILPIYRIYLNKYQPEFVKNVNIETSQKK